MPKISAYNGDQVVRLVAEFRAWSQTTVKWYKENGEITSNDSKYQMSFENSVAELAILKVTNGDAGQYTVVASSQLGEALLTTNLIVHGAVDGRKNRGETHLLPSILLQPLANLMIRVGKKARFTVAACCPPEPQVQWYRDKDKVQETDKYLISRQGGVCTLDIATVEPSDNNTTWKCEIITGFGYAVSTARLHAIVPKGYHKPEFLEGLKALLTAQGTVSLECKVVGVPTPLLQWFKDGKEIKAGDMFNLGTQSNDENSLGVYTCVAINCMGKAVSSAQVTVTDKTDDKLKPKLKVEEPVPVFIEGLEDKTVKVGENFRFHVRVRTPPPTKVTWYNNDELIEANEKYHLAQVDECIYCLDIIPIELNDDGLWRCVATNQYGNTTSPCRISLTVPKNYRGPEFVEGLVAIFTDDGLVSFECKVIGVPTPILRWYKDGVELKPGDVHQLSGTNSLGSYSCVAKNCMGIATSVAELTLEDIYGAKERRKPPAKQPPCFTQHLKDEQVFIGQNFCFTVSVKCPPIPEVTWYKDNVRIEESEKQHFRREKNGIYHLDIDALDLSDQGVYKCLAVNDYGHTLTQGVLRVVIPKQYKKPKFIENLRAVLSEEGTVSLECKVVGVPQPVLKWFKDGIELKAGDIYKIVSGEGGTSSLGTYTCEARNCMGTASSTAALLAFDDKSLRDRYTRDVYQQDLSTIEEKDEFSTYGTPSVTDNWDESKAEIEFSIYETPDITEDEARQIIEIFADEVSEYVSIKEAPSELPPLRFIKESAVVGNIIMDALIIDVPIEFCSQVDEMGQQTALENLATEADVADISAIDPVIVDLPYDYSEAASLHELKIDISESEADVQVKETSFREAVIVDAPLLLSSQDVSDTIHLYNKAETACQLERSLLEPVVVTCAEKLGTFKDTEIAAHEKEVAIVVQEHENVMAKVAIVEPLVIQVAADNVVVTQERQGQQQQQSLETPRPVFEFEDEQLSSEEVTPSENLGTDADVESIASVEEFTTDFVNGFSDDCTHQDARAADEEVRRIEEAASDDFGRTTPTYESAMDCLPEERNQMAPSYLDATDATPTPTPGYEIELLGRQLQMSPNLLETYDKQGETSRQHGKQPGMLAEIASAVLHKAAEGIITTAVIAESLVTAATSIIMPPEDTPDEGKEEMFTFSEEDIIQEQKQARELQRGAQPIHVDAERGTVSDEQDEQSVVRQKQQFPEEEEEEEEVNDIARSLQIQEVLMNTDKTNSAQDIRESENMKTDIVPKKENDEKLCLEQTTTAQEHSGLSEQQETCELLPESTVQLPKDDRLMEESTIAKDNVTIEQRECDANENIEIKSSTLSNVQQHHTENIPEEDLITAVTEEEEEEEEVTFLDEAKPVSVNIASTLMSTSKSSSMIVEDTLVMEETIEGTSTHVMDEVIGVASAHSINEATSEATPIRDAEKETVSASEILEGGHTATVEAACTGIVNQERGSEAELAENATFSTDHSQLANITEVENLLDTTPFEVTSQQVMEVTSQRGNEEAVETPEQKKTIASYLKEATVSEDIPLDDTVEEHATAEAECANAMLCIVENTVADSYVNEAVLETSQVVAANDAVKHCAEQTVTPLDACPAVSSTEVVTEEDSHVITADDYVKPNDSTNATVVDTDICGLEKPIHIASMEVMTQIDSIVATIQETGTSDSVETLSVTTVEQCVAVAAIEVITQEDAVQQTSEPPTVELDDVQPETEPPNAIEESTTLVQLVTNADGAADSVTQFPSDAGGLRRSPIKEVSDESTSQQGKPTDAITTNVDSDTANNRAAMFDKFTEQLIATCFRKAFEEANVNLKLALKKVPTKIKDQASLQKGKKERKARKTSDEKTSAVDKSLLQVTDFADVMSRGLLHDVLESMRNVINEWRTEEYFSSEMISAKTDTLHRDESDSTDTTVATEASQLEMKTASEATVDQKAITKNEDDVDKKISECKEVEEQQTVDTGVPNRDETTMATCDGNTAAPSPDKKDEAATPSIVNACVDKTSEFDVPHEGVENEVTVDDGGETIITQIQNETATIDETCDDQAPKDQTEPLKIDCNISDSSTRRTEAESHEEHSVLSDDFVLQTSTETTSATAMQELTNVGAAKQVEILSEIDADTNNYKNGERSPIEAENVTIPEPPETNKFDATQPTSEKTITTLEDPQTEPVQSQREEKEVKKLTKKRKSVLKKSKSLVEETVSPPITIEDLTQQLLQEPTETIVNSDRCRPLSPQDSYDKSELERLSDHSDTMSVKGVTDLDDSDVSQDFPRSEGSKESRLLRRNSRKEKRRGSKKSDSTCSLKSQDSRDSSTGEQTDEGEDFPSHPVEVHRAKKALRTTSGDLARIRELDDENSLEAERRRQSCPHVESVSEKMEQEHGVTSDEQNCTILAETAQLESQLEAEAARESKLDPATFQVSKAEAETAHQSTTSHELKSVTETAEVETKVCKADDQEPKLKTETLEETKVEPDAAQRSNLENKLSNETKSETDELKLETKAAKKSKSDRTESKKKSKVRKTAENKSKLESDDATKVSKTETDTAEPTLKVGPDDSEESKLNSQTVQDSQVRAETVQDLQMKAETVQDSQEKTETVHEKAVANEESKFGTDVVKKNSVEIKNSEIEETTSTTTQTTEGPQPGNQETNQTTKNVKFNGKNSEAKKKTKKSSNVKTVNDAKSSDLSPQTIEAAEKQITDSLKSDQDVAREDLIIVSDAQNGSNETDDCEISKQDPAIAVVGQAIESTPDGESHENVSSTEIEKKAQKTNNEIEDNLKETCEKLERNKPQLTEFEKIKEDLRGFSLDKVPRGAMTIEELDSSFEDSSTDKTPINVVIESASDQTDDDDVTLIQEDLDTMMKDMDESLMGIEEIPLEDLTIEDVIENVRTLKRLQTITEVDEITDEDDGGEHIVIATLKPCWSDDTDETINRRAHSLQPVEQQIHHTVEPLQRRKSHGDSTSTELKRTKDSPQFIMKLHDFSIPVDYRMRLTCCVIGSPDPKVQWLKNGKAITSDMGYREINDFGICVLEIPRASHSDSGEFTCIASNVNGQDRTTGQLTVKGKAKPDLTEPTFTRSILNMKGYCGDSITMDCTVIGWPMPNVTWLKDNAPLVLNDRVETKAASGGTHRLTISEANVADSGVYRCVAQNSLGKDEITASVKIMDKPSHSSRFVRDSLTKKATSANSSYDSSSSYDSFDIDGSTPGYNRAAQLTFISQLEDRNACLGSTVSFHCETTGKPRPEITWLHNGKPLQPNGHIKFSQQDNTSMLTILGSSYSDLGLYTCKATNSSGTVYTSACLSFGLQGEAMEFGLAPIFITKPQSLNVGKDEKIVLTCKVEGKPRPKVTWLKGARDMSLSSRAYKDSKGDIHKLVIHRAMNVDDGEYIVEAKNKLGKEVVRCSVTVSRPSNADEDWDYRKTTSALDKLKGYRQYVPRKELPGPIGSTPKITDMGRNWVTLMWSRPDNDGGSSILAYRIEACELPDNTWEEVGLSPITICDVYNLKPDSEYLIRVSARNMFGWGPHVSMTEPFKIKRRPDMPHFTSIPPSCLQAHTSTSITLDCLVAGKPTPDIRWYKNRELIVSLRNNRYRTKFDGLAASLTITDVRSEDEGCYTCEAVSDGGRATAFTVLGVEEGPGAANQLQRSSDQEEQGGGGIPPVLTMRLRNRTVTVNHLVRLTCQIQASPLPDVQWYKDGVQITNSEEHLVLREGSFHTLEIVRAQVKDAGEYTVVFRNNQGRISNKCQLDVNTSSHKPFSAPTLLQPLEDGVATEGHSLSVRCRTTNHPSRKVTWYRNGQTLTHCRKHRINALPDGTCVLTIVQMTAGDSGTYTCTVANEMGRVSTNAEIRVQHRAQDKPSAEFDSALNAGYSKTPLFLTKPRSTEVFENDTVELLCEVIGDPKPEVLWLRDGLKFEYQKDPEHFLRLGDGPLYKLEIPSVTIDDTGRYAVIARNCHGDTKAIISLQVLARGQEVADNHMEYRTQTKAGNVATRPEVLQTLNNVQCVDGESVTFECRVRSVPLPEIRWEKDGHILKPSADFQQQHDGSVCRLRIAEVFPDDAGEYVCVAYNDAGRVTTSACLSVLRSEEKENNSLYSARDGAMDVTSKPIRRRLVSEVPPRFKRRNVGPKFVTHPHNRVVDEGETVKFTCSMAGHPDPTVQWEKCGRLMKSDGRIQVIDNDDLHSLLIAEVTPHDTGTYTVTATNCIGKVYATVKLDVIAKKKGKTRSYVSSPAPHPGTGVGWSTAGGRSGRMFTITAFEGPRVLQSLTDTVITSGDRLALACQVHGIPRPTITWTINDKVLSKRWNCRTKYDGRTASLEIASFEGHHGVGKADVCCTAANVHGTAKTTAKLTIKGRTKANRSLPVTCQTLPVKLGDFGDSVLRSKTKPSDAPIEPIKQTKPLLRAQTKPQLVKSDIDRSSSMPTRVTTGHSLRPLNHEKSTTARIANGESTSVANETEHFLSHVVSLLKETVTTECPPTFVEHLTDVFTQDGNRVSLNVEVSGTPPFEVIWVRNDRQVLNSDNFSYVSHGCDRHSLVIDDVFPEDAGIYVCEVYNAFGNCETRCKVHVKEPNCLGPPSVATVKPRILTGFADQLEVEDGDNFVLQTQITACPKPTVTWFKDGHKLQPFIRIKTECIDGDKYTLDIARIRVRDAGIYAVTASNSSGTATATTAVSVKPKSTACKAPSIGDNVHHHNPQIVPTSPDKDSPHDQNCTSVDIGNSTDCDSSAMSSVGPLFSSDHVEEEELPAALQVHNLTNGTAERRNVPPAITIKESPAQIIRGPQNTTVLEGQKVHLKVYFIGKPRPTVKWIKGGRMVESNERIKMETCEEMSCLTMENVHSDDSGKYIVVVENGHGADCHFASLAVEGAPEPPASRPVVTQASSSAITLCWYGSSYDGGSVITGYIVEVSRVSDQEQHSDTRQWQRVTSNCHSTSYVVRGLEPAMEYVFRVRAQNVHGTSRPTEESEPVFIVERNVSSGEESRPQSPEFYKVSIEDGSHFNEMYDVQEELGKGRFGRVHRVIEKKTGIEYAGKFIRCIKSRDKEKVKEEVDVMNSLCHTKLLKLIAAFEKLREMIIVLEYISGGELFERVVAEDFVLTERDCILFTRQICEGVRYMHEQSIMHLDLKPENILCLHREGHLIKLIDFGLAKRYDPDNPIRVMFGTPEFVAPEVINYEYISPASDMWSVGVICYVLLSGLSPFMGENDVQTFSNITKSEFDFDDEAFDAISQDAKDFIVSLLIKKKEKRMSAQECLKHHWLAQHERTMSAVKLCTDKLKKFIVRRKWQKTGNAILALGRMVSLSGLNTRRTPLYSYSSGFGSNLSDSSDCDTSSNTSYRVAAQGSRSIPETDEDSYLADSSSESYQSDRKDSGSIKSENMFQKRPSSELGLDIKTKHTTLD